MKEKRKGKGGKGGKRKGEEEKGGGKGEKKEEKGKRVLVCHLIPVLKHHCDSRREVSQVIPPHQHTRKINQTIFKKLLQYTSLN